MLSPVFLPFIALAQLLLMTNLYGANQNNENKALIIGTDKCGECHKQEIAQWRKTLHYQAFYDLDQSNKGKSIKRYLGIKNSKKSSLCINCHYTEVQVDDKPVIHAISCESCHSPAKNWLDIHHDYGGKSIDKQSESNEHKMMRLKKSSELGMIRAENIYRLGKQCYGCHFNTSEKLVNQGKHRTASDFELLSWSQGSIRHNFLEQIKGHNRKSTLNRKRLLYLIGQCLDIEFGIRNLSKVTKNEKFAEDITERIRQTAKKLYEIYNIVPLEPIRKILLALKTNHLSNSQQQELLSMADNISKLTLELEQQHDGSLLSKLDELLPEEDDYIE